MGRLDDADFRRKFKELFNGETQLAEQLCDDVELFCNVDVDLASEVTQILNIISTSWALKYSFSEYINQLSDNDVLNIFGIEYVVAIVHKWLSHVNKQATEVVDEKSIDNYVTLDDGSVDSWDEYFFNVARQTAKNSKCFSRHIGAVVVKDKSIVGTGYNSPPRGVPTCDKRWGIDKSLGEVSEKELKHLVGECPRKVLGYKSGEGMDLCVASHAEESAIVNCARMGISTKDASLYLTCNVPCGKCAVKIINSGIKEVIVTGLQQYDKVAQYLFDNSTVKIRVYDFIK